MARRIPSEFVPLDVHFQRELSDVLPTSELLFVRALAYVRLHKTDGALTRRDLEDCARGLRRPRENAAELVAHGFWVATDTGWRIKAWEKWNGSKEQVSAEKAAQQAAQALTTHKRFHLAEDRINPSCEHCQAIATDVASEIASGSQKKKEREKENERERESVPSDVAYRSAGDADASAQTLIGEWIDHCPTRPPGRVIGQLSKEVKALLDEGQPYEDVRAGLAAWHSKGLHPSTLASVVHETRTARPSTTRSTRVDENLAVARQIAQRDGIHQPAREIGA
jgi:hypothetical protein